MLKVLTKWCEPTKGSKYSACIDLRASHDCVIGAGETKVIGLGVAIDSDAIFRYCNSPYDNFSKDENKKLAVVEMERFMKSHFMQLSPRSSLLKKHGLIMAEGKIDLDYKDEIMAVIHNPITDDDFSQHLGMEILLKTQYTINKGDRIAQITLIEHKAYLMGIGTDAERTGGLGSTGVS